MNSAIANEQRGYAYQAGKQFGKILLLSACTATMHVMRPPVYALQPQLLLSMKHTESIIQVLPSPTYPCIDACLWVASQSNKPKLLKLTLQSAR